MYIKVTHSLSMH